ncbi:hypothetical protein [Pleurocapsa sp. PCC 7319]|uniref:hypothetical protein n=1 Tax=Pleurocapsa sp. PCC 7319 TaxID=118161 RepID=UPI000345CBD8|nr:hypothetical protein [Pleurocapsa sp. PCC 7319]
MSPRKLTEDDKQNILKLYRNSEATTSTLASRYEVSSSTISRFLKNKLTPAEYEDLIQQKRLARTPRGEKSTPKVEQTATSTKKKSPSKSTKTKPKTVPDQTEEVVADEDANVADLTIDSAATDPKSIPVRRRRSSVNLEQEEFIEESKLSELAIEQSNDDTSEVIATDRPSTTLSDRGPILKTDRVDLEEQDEDDEDNEVEIITLKEMLGEDLEDINEEEDDEDDEDVWEDDTEESITFSRNSESFSDIQILPLSKASLPRSCYLVIDRSAELIVKPLADFADLGLIPQEETKQRTLPVFDNHRIAKRFSHRRERVIKVPDSRMLQKTSRHLQDKGITRLLIDGQIYSLSS